MASDQETTPRDAGSWARHVGPLRVDAAPHGARNLNVDGRRLAGPLQGFGKLWQKTYRVDLVGATVTPEELIATWKANYGDFWPDSNVFHAPPDGIEPGAVGLIDADLPAGLKLSTGVMVLYADDVSFTYMTPLGHPFAGWITFSATDQGGTTTAQVDVLMRATDPASELGLALGGHRSEDRMWVRTLDNLAAHVGVADPQVATSMVCVDGRRQWKRVGNLRHQAVLHTAAHLLLGPHRRLARVGALVLALGLAVSAAATLATASDGPDGDDVALVVDDFAWSPETIRVDPAGTINVDNRDPFLHTFTVEELGIDVRLPASTARDVTLADVAPGRYAVVCTVPGHEAMTGTVEIAS